MTKRVLLIDDDKQFLHAMSVRIRQLGLEVATVFNDRQAMAAIAEYAPDLICIDVLMPCANGLEIGEFLKQEGITSETPVVILTGRKDRDTMQRIDRLSAYYVHKSSEVWTSLKAVICEVLDVRPSLCGTTAE